LKGLLSGSAKATADVRYVGANCRAVDGTWKAAFLQCAAGTGRAEDGPSWPSQCC